MDTKPDGQLTAEVAERLAAYYGKKGYKVIHDHGPKKEDVGHIVSWLGEVEKRAEELSQLDIAIIKRDPGDLYALIEIEEERASPKKLLGDVFATLLCDHVSFEKETLSVDEQIILIVMAKGNESDKEGIEFLNRKVESVRSALGGSNLKFGKVLIGLFHEKDDLERRLLQEIGI
jgi:hypothetical protein